MRILTFTTLYPSALQPQHGIFVETRLRNLVASGAVDARVVAPCPWFPFSSARFGRYALFAGIPREETRHGLHIDHPRYPILPKIGMSAAPLGLFAAILPLLRRQIGGGLDFDLIDAHYFYPDGPAAVLLGRALGRPAVVTARGSDLNIIAGHVIPRQWIRWAAQHADGLVAVSSGLRQRLVELGIAAERVQVLRNGVDLALFRPYDRAAARQTLGFIRPTVLAVGNLMALKRHNLMVEALAQLTGVDLVIVGEGAARAAIENLARKRGVADRVRLPGRVPQGRLPEFYSAADLLLLVSTHEGWPNVLLESMACGTPVVVSDIDGITDFLAALPARAATRAYAERFDWRSTTEEQIALFREICKQRPIRRGVAHAA